MSIEKKKSSEKFNKNEFDIFNDETDANFYFIIYQIDKEIEQIKLISDENLKNTAIQNLVEDNIFKKIFNLQNNTYKKIIKRIKKVDQKYSIQDIKHIKQTDYNAPIPRDFDKIVIKPDNIDYIKIEIDKFKDLENFDSIYKVIENKKKQAEKYIKRLKNMISTRINITDDDRIVNFLKNILSIPFDACETCGKKQKKIDISFYPIEILSIIVSFNFRKSIYFENKDENEVEKKNFFRYYINNYFNSNYNIEKELIEIEFICRPEKIIIKKDGEIKFVSNKSLKMKKLQKLKNRYKNYDIKNIIKNKLDNELIDKYKNLKKLRDNINNKITTIVYEPFIVNNKQLNDRIFKIRRKNIQKQIDKIKSKSTMISKDDKFRIKKLEEKIKIDEEKFSVNDKLQKYNDKINKFNVIKEYNKIQNEYKNFKFEHERREYEEKKKLRLEAKQKEINTNKELQKIYKIRNKLENKIDKINKEQIELIKNEIIIKDKKEYDNVKKDIEELKDNIDYDNIKKQIKEKFKINVPKEYIINKYNDIINYYEENYTDDMDISKNIIIRTIKNRLRRRRNLNNIEEIKVYLTHNNILSTDELDSVSEDEWTNIFNELKIEKEKKRGSRRKKYRRGGRRG